MKSSIAKVWPVVLAVAAALFAAGPARAEMSAEELAKLAQNPVGNLISVPFQNNTNFNAGPLNGTQNILNIQPVIPIEINADWNIITRTIVPVIWQPALSSTIDSTTGIGDTVFTAFLSPAQPHGLIWGVGPVVQLPTNSNDELGNKNWGLGPSFVVLKLEKGNPWVYGVLVNNIWSLSNNKQGGAYNNGLIQPFLNYNFAGGLYLTSAPILTVDWKADSGQRWTMPLGGGIGKIFHLGKLPVNTQLSRTTTLCIRTTAPTGSCGRRCNSCFRNSAANAFEQSHPKGATLKSTGGCMNRIIAKALALVGFALLSGLAQAQPQQKPNVLIIWGDDIGYWNLSAYNLGMMGYKTPNIDRIAKEGALFTDWYGQQSCTAGRAAFITGQSPYRTGLLKVGLPGAKEGLQARDVTIADLLKAQGYMTGQFGKNHLGDLDEHLPTAHGFQEFMGSLYHLNAEDEPEHEDYFKRDDLRKKYGTRGVIHTWANPDGTQKIESTGPLNKKRMETDRRRGHQGNDPLHGRREEGRQAVFPLVELDPHAHLDAAEGSVARQDRSRHLPRRHARARRARRPAARRAEGDGSRPEHHRDVLDRQRRREIHVARRRHVAVPR